MVTPGPPLPERWQRRLVASARRERRRELRHMRQAMALIAAVRLCASAACAASFASANGPWALPL